MCARESERETYSGELGSTNGTVLIESSKSKERESIKRILMHAPERVRERASERARAGRE